MLSLKKCTYLSLITLATFAYGSQAMADSSTCMSPADITKKLQFLNWSEERANLTYTATDTGIRVSWGNVNNTTYNPSAWLLWTDPDVNKVKPIKLTKLSVDGTITVHLDDSVNKGYKEVYKVANSKVDQTLNLDLSSYFSNSPTENFSIIVAAYPVNNNIKAGYVEFSYGCEKKVEIPPVVVDPPKEPDPEPPKEPEPPKPDYTQKLCTGLEEDACREKLESFCSVSGNELYNDCKEWDDLKKQVVEEDKTSTGNGAPTGSNIIGVGGKVSGALMFSPTAFATQLVVGWISDLFTCSNSMSDEEKELPKRLGANLCIYVGEYCSKTVSVLGVKMCRTKKKTYCCFNSTLARIINTEGNKQLGRNMGDPKEATCQGFTLDEFNKLDLSKMDLSEFVAEVSAKAESSANAKGADYWADRNNVRVQSTWQNATTDVNDLEVKLLTSDNPYSVIDQPTSKSASTQSTARTVADETAVNTPKAIETGVSTISADEINEAKRRLLAQ